MLKKFFKKEKQFLVLIGLFFVAILAFRNQPRIAMWIGFALAGYSAIANDSVQSLGSFLASNQKVKWWILWLFLGGILVSVFSYGYFMGDVSFGRLDKIPEVQEFHIIQLFAPLILLFLTRFKMPVSTTFLLLAVFSDSKTITGMLEKTVMGYFVAFFSAALIWTAIATLMKKKIFFKKNYNRSLWKVLQWGATAYLWSSWLMQDTANVVVFLPRDLLPLQFGVIAASLFVGLGVLIYLRGGKIQEIITEKTDVLDPRSATIIDFVFGTILFYFKGISNLPMSTTWVFLGLLAGRESALTLFSGKEIPYAKTLRLVMKDLFLAGVGLGISVLIASMV
ncbi:MAG: hypothetical protein ACI9QC_000191 [Oceanicoccus sp.]|jgi:hypothetical protein